MIKEVRKRKMVTAKSVAEMLGVTYETYMRYESGKISISTEQLMNIAIYLGCSMDELVDRDDLRSDEPIKSKIDHYYIGLNEEGRKKVAELVELVFMNPAYRASWE